MRGENWHLIILATYAKIVLKYLYFVNLTQTLFHDKTKFVICTLGGGDLTTINTEPFVVLTYNIRFGKGLDNVQDLARTAHVIKESKAELVGLQEVDQHNPKRSGNVDQANFLATTLDLNYHYTPALKGESNFGNAILSSFPILERDDLILPKKGTTEDRAVAITKVLVGEWPVIFMATHLGLAKGERLEHIELILDFLKNVDTPVVLVGDWNEQPGSPTYNRITEVLVDAATKRGKEQPTFPYLALYENQANVRIDFIFVSPEIEVIDVEVIDNWASDHLPVKATLALKKKGGT